MVSCRCRTMLSQEWLKTTAFTILQKHLVRSLKWALQG